MKPPIRIKFYRIHPNAVIPEYKEKGSVGADLSLLENVVISPKEYKAARTGLVAQLIPEGCACHIEIVLRSSTPKKYSGLILANHVGIVDQTYTGPEDELYICLYNTSEKTYELKQHERVAQVIIRPTIKGNIIAEDAYESKPYGLYARRSRGGLGSTG